MGLSHLAILSRIDSQSEVAVCESSFLMRYVYRRFKFRTFASLDSALASLIKWMGAVMPKAVPIIKIVGSSLACRASYVQTGAGVAVMDQLALVRSFFNAPSVAYIHDYRIKVYLDRP